jgi:glycosyltransferase involved in cell wall biosynthesis
VAIRVLTFGRFADENFGGLERYVFELARALQGEVDFTNIVARRGAAPDAERGGHTVYSTPVAYLAGAPLCPSMPIHARLLHHAKPFDIVHLQFPADPMAHVASLMLPRSVKRVITWHSDIVRQRKFLRLYGPFLKRLVQSADAIIIPTPAHFTSSEQLPRWISPDRTCVVPFGLDYRRFIERPPLAEQIRGKRAGRFLVFTLGRHVYYKGYQYLIQAMSEVPDAVLIIGGTGPLTAELRSLVQRLRLESRVEMIGRIADADLPAYYHACDVFCMPSVERAEAFGIVQLEAMACGKAVVCCELGNGVNWVNVDGVSGIVVPPRDPGALAQVLRRLMIDEVLRAELGNQARERAMQRFSSDGMARGTLAVYRSALYGKPQ